MEVDLPRHMRRLGKDLKGLRHQLHSAELVEPAHGTEPVEEGFLEWNEMNVFKSPARAA